MKKSIAPLLLSFLLSQCAIREEKMLYVEILISESVAKEGAVIFMIPHKLQDDIFIEKYSNEKEDGMNDDGEKYQYKFTNLVSNPINFVHFDTPGARYRYRFVGDQAGMKISEKLIGVAGAGNIYIDKDNNDPVPVDGGIDHVVNGSVINESVARFIQDSTLDFQISDQDCTATTGVLICVPNREATENMLRRANKNGQQ